ncbi:Hypothetical protein PHPALM_3164 [Phytophthora palmivora]|uniref:Uncharacterized protein n=1 Tax=Phytophthora palmivora TaxID=4796 RepID=A0A2P4YN25_9STRA|nr:Hypothetical protein PHPALM_3164 [Phytophthora palmivora]
MIDRTETAEACTLSIRTPLEDVVQTKQEKLTPDLTSHSFRRGATMHANVGSLAENWIIERDRVNKAFAYMWGTTLSDQKVVCVLSGWNPKDGARHPLLRALKEPNLSRALKLQALCCVNTFVFADPALNLDEELAEALTATLVMHYPNVLLLANSSAFIVRMRESMAALAIGEAEQLAWRVAIRRAFTPSPALTESHDCSAQCTALVDLLKKQSEQINILILQNKRIGNGY